MIQRAYSIVISSMLVIMLTVPLLIFLVVPNKIVSQAEKRTLLKLPSFSLTKNQWSEYPEKFNAYFQDHFGLRDTYIDLYDSLVLNIFHVSPSPYIIKGKDDWYFYVAGTIRSDFFGLTLPDQLRQERYSQTIIDKRIWLNALGIQYLFIPVPNKINVYPEKLPARIKRLGGRTFYDQIASYRIDDLGKHNILDTLEVLQAGKQARQVFYRTDTHWNNDGALLVFNQLINKLNRWFPELQQISEEDVIRTKKRFNGDLKNVLHKISTVNEVEEKISLITNCTKKKNRTIAKDLSKYISKEDRKSLLPVENGCAGKKLTVLVLHDSFGEHLRKYFNIRFKTVIYSRKYNFHELLKLIEHLRPDVVIEQGVARNLRQLLKDDIELEQMVVEHQMDKNNKTVINVSKSTDISTFYQIYNASVRASDDGLEVVATSEDPQLMLPLFTDKKSKRYNVMLEISAPENTQIQLFYSKNHEKVFTEKHLITRKIQKGYNKLFFHIPSAGIDRYIRLDPGSIAGVYNIHSFIVKER